MVVITIEGNGLTVWHGQEGHAFALSIGRRQRHSIVRFVVRKTRTLPVVVKINQLRRHQQEKVYACLTGDFVQVGLTYKTFFILLQYQDVSDDVMLYFNDNMSVRHTHINL